jgi:hypothetical protein
MHHVYLGQEANFRRLSRSGGFAICERFRIFVQLGILAWKVVSLDFDSSTSALTICGNSCLYNDTLSKTRRGAVIFIVKRPKMGNSQRLRPTHL